MAHWIQLENGFNEGIQCINVGVGAEVSGSVLDYVPRLKDSGKILAGDFERRI